MDIAVILKQSKHSVTEPRRLVFQALAGAKEPLSMAELMRHVPLTDRSTIYRTVELFERLGIIKRVWFGLKSRLELSEQIKPHHHHIVCQQCGRVEDIEPQALEVLLGRISRKHGFRHTSHHVEIVGICDRH